MSRTLIAALLAGALVTPVAAQDGWTAMGPGPNGEAMYWRPGGPGRSGVGYQNLQIRTELNSPDTINDFRALSFIWVVEIRCSDLAHRKVRLALFEGRDATGGALSLAAPAEDWSAPNVGSQLHDASRAVCR